MNNKHLDKDSFNINPSAAQKPQNEGQKRVVEDDKKQRPYCVLKYQQMYMAASNKLIQFFTMHNIKKYIEYDKKTKFQKQLMQQILKQLREFLRKKAARQFQNFMARDKSGDLTLQEKFQYFDQIFFRKLIADGINTEKNKPQQLANLNPFETSDIEDEILNQLETSLAKIYAQI